MFKNKYFIRNPHLSREMIKCLNNLGKTSQKIQELEKQFDDIKVNVNQLKEQATTGEESEDVKNVKESKEDGDWKDELTIQHIKFYTFLCSSVGKGAYGSQLLQHQKIPRLNLSFLKKQEKEQHLTKAEKLINQAIGQQENLLNSLKQKQYSSRLKIFVLYEKLCENVEKKIGKQPKLYETCHQILLDLFRLELIYLTNERIKNKQMEKLEQSKKEEEKQPQQQKTNHEYFPEVD